MMKTPWSDMPMEQAWTCHPMPQLRRDDWLNLNGLWDYAICRGFRFPDRFDGTIRVPFSPESPLSGVERTLHKDETLWYRRTFALDEARRSAGHVLLHFGAVDQEAWVYCNGTEVGYHRGGYTPFTVEITPYVQAENELVVKVRDDTDATWHSRGKQKSDRGGIWYTPQSGIWQTVWLECVPENYITGLTVTPRLENDTVELTIHTLTAAPCVLTLDGRDRGVFTNRTLQVHVDQPRLWSPEDPYLYHITLTMGADRVHSYFAMRSFAVGQDEAGVKRLLLNGKPYFHNGLLDQGYYPDGLYTAPCEAAMEFDIRTMKDLGFNMLRKHIKVEPLYWYYLCDSIGMLVWQDMPNGGGKYDRMTISSPLVTGLHFRDDDYKRFARADAQGRAAYLQELDEMIDTLYNCPCIAMWVPFNEGWGQFDAAAVAQHVLQRDPTRTVDHASGWHDQKWGDIQSLHVYFRAYHYRSDKLGRAVVLSEYGGYNLRVEGHSQLNKSEYGYRHCKDAAALNEALGRLWEKQIIPAKEKGLSAAVYTQLSDVEDELNGIMTYDRQVVKPDAALLRALNARLRG